MPPNATYVIYIFCNNYGSCLNEFVVIRYFKVIELVEMAIFYQFYLILGLQSGYFLCTFLPQCQCLGLHVSRRPYLHCKFFPHKKYGEIPVSQSVPCNKHVIIMGIASMPEIPIVSHFRYACRYCIRKICILTCYQLRIYRKSPQILQKYPQKLFYYVISLHWGIPIISL